MMDRHARRRGGRRRRSHDSLLLLLLLLLRRGSHGRHLRGRGNRDAEVAAGRTLSFDELFARDKDSVLLMMFTGNKRNPNPGRREQTQRDQRT